MRMIPGQSSLPCHSQPASERFPTLVYADDIGHGPTNSNRNTRMIRPTSQAFSVTSVTPPRGT